MKSEVPTKELQLQPPTSHTKKLNLSRSNIEFRVNAMKVADLKKGLKARGYDASGLKKDLRARLLDLMLVELDVEGSLDPTSSLPTAKPLQQSPACLDEEIDGRKKSFCDEGSVVHEEKLKNMMEKDSMIKLNEVKKMSIESMHREQEQRPQKTRDSVSSMQVEHHSIAIAPPRGESTSHVEVVVKTISIPQADSTTALTSGVPTSMVPKRVVSTDIDTTGHSSPLREKSCGSSPPAFTNVKEIENMKEAKRDHPLVEKFEMGLVKVRKDEGAVESIPEEISPPVSEVSSTSKASGKIVKDMISKFSGFSSLSSTISNSSSVSKDMKAIKDARMARIHEMREKASPCF